MFRKFIERKVKDTIILSLAARPQSFLPLLIFDLEDDESLQIINDMSDEDNAIYEENKGS